MCKPPRGVLRLTGEAPGGQPGSQGAQSCRCSFLGLGSAVPLSIVSRGSRWCFQHFSDSNEKFSLKCKCVLFRFDFWSVSRGCFRRFIFSQRVREERGSRRKGRVKELEEGLWRWSRWLVCLLVFLGKKWKEIRETEHEVPG